MTIHEAIYTAFLRQSILSVHFLLLAVQMAMIFIILRDGRRLRVILSSMLHFAAGFAVFYIALLDIFLRNDSVGTPPAFLAVCRAFPLGVLIGYEVLTLTALVLSLLDVIRYRKTHPTVRSIKETIDLLPAGIAFVREDGRPALHNLVMDTLSEEVNGKAFTQLQDLWKTDQENGEGPGQGNVRTLRLQKEDQKWQVLREEVTVEGERFTQLTASDITLQSGITEELEEKNEKLRDIHMRLDIYNKQADRMIIAKELLTARMAVHNEVGNVLLESRHYLEDPDSFDEKMLLRALQNTNTYLLREYEQDDSAGDPLMDALEMADAIGVTVRIDGEIPEEEPCRNILSAAIIECATNTVKHANGNEIRVKTVESDRFLTCTLSGNGREPRGEISESGGLRSLRMLTEEAGGTMQILVSQNVRIIISLSRKTAGE